MSRSTNSCRNLLVAIGLLALAACASPPPPPPGLTPAQIAVLKDDGFTDNGDNWELGIDGKLLFGSNEDALSADTLQTVDKVGRSLLSVGIDHLRVEGHTDARGTDSYNDQLSLRRANAVSDVLVHTGFKLENIDMLGLGKRVPVADNKTASGRSENRRVSIVIPVPGR